MQPSRKPRNLAVIPARGGSKRIPRKNMAIVSGRRMLEWPIETCLRSGLFERVLVSTDDAEIAEAARSAGAEVPFLRDRNLSGDEAPTLPVVVDAINRLGSEGQMFDNVCCIYPSAIFTTVADLVDSQKLLKERADQNFVMGMVRYSHPIQRAIRVDDTGRARFINPELAASRTQDLEPAWYDAGQFYWGRASAWLNTRHPMESALAFELPAARVQDIDTLADLERAVQLHAALSLIPPAR